MYVPRFYLLSIEMFTSYKYAWYEIYGKANYSREYPRCPKCGRAVGGLYWQPPYNVVLKQPHTVGDFVNGAGGCNCLVSERFLSLYKREELKGIEKILPINIIRMGTTEKAKLLIPPKLSGIYFRHSLTRVNYDEMGIEWMKKPKPDYCVLCGPGGGGGKFGIVHKREKIVVEINSWEGDDMFFAINLPGSILLSERAANMIVNNQLTNASVIPCEEAKHST
jgi:hypothetical protein